MSSLRSAIVLVLVTLAASPLTVPFATCDLLDVFGEDAPPSASVIKPPSTNQAPVLAAVAPSDCQVAQRPVTAPLIGRLDVRAPAPHVRPLRI